MKTKARLFDRLKTSLREGIAYTRGELDLRTIDVPDEPPEIDAKTVMAIRLQSRMSQAVFAKVLNVSYKTVQSWERGTRKPSYASRRLLQVFSESPEVVCRIVGVPKISLRGIKTVSTADGRKRIVVQPLH